MASAVTVSLLAGPAAFAADAGTSTPATPGTAGLPYEKLFPTLGNGGYTVDHYDLDLRYATSAPSQAIDGTVTVKAVATQALSRFDLDFAGDAVGSVSVDGKAATFVRDGEELQITPPAPLREGQRFVVTVAHFAATPTVPVDDKPLSQIFIQTPDGSAWAVQPDGAHRIFPCNDHPSDKASFSFRIDVPTGTTAVANGALIRSTTAGDRTIWQYDQTEPMATELAQVAVGALTVVPRPSVDGVTLRDVIPTRLVEKYAPRFANVGEDLAWMKERVGDYPFRSYGELLADVSMGYVLESQTLSLFDMFFLNSVPAGATEGAKLHELSHQWFGNSVTPYRWSDVWLSEGHATWYTMAYESEHGILDQDLGWKTSGDLTELIKKRYSQGDQWRAQYGPVAQPNGDDVFNANVYTGGALVLYALQQKLGAEKFSQLERQWVSQFRDRSVTTEDFITLATRIGGPDVAPFLQSWLYGTTTPPMPGHPDWTVLPVTPTATPTPTATATATSTLPPTVTATSAATAARARR